MKDQLRTIAASYDETIEAGKKGINPYANLPEHITGHPDYPAFAQIMEAGSGSDSCRQEIKGFLMPESGMHFVDLGCCLNLMFNGYDTWPSTYYGVDISEKTIGLLEQVVSKRDLSVGSLVCGSIHETPFDNNFFDIAACIGTLEYFQEDFVRAAIKEMTRIMKPGGRLVLDVPNLQSPLFEINRLIEAHLGRPDTFDMTRKAFEALLVEDLQIVRSDEVVGMIQYFLVKKG